MDPCVIHRYSMGLCVKCNEPPLGGPAAGSKPEPPVTENADGYATNGIYRAVTLGNWDREYVYCLSCKRFGEWDEGLNGAPCPHPDCDATGSKCANKIGSSE